MVEARTIIDTIELSIDKDKTITTTIFDYGTISTMVPEIEHLHKDDVQAYLNLYEKKVVDLENLSNLNKLKNFMKRIVFALNLLRRPKKRQRINSIINKNGAITITTRTPSEPIAVTSLKLNGDISVVVSQKLVTQNLVTIHTVNTNYSMLMWREDLKTFLHVLKQVNVAWPYVLVMTGIAYVMFFGSLSRIPDLLLFTSPVAVGCTIVSVIMQLIRKR
jgi:hypothetical protein